MSKTDATIRLEKAIRIVTNKMGVFGCHEVTIGFNGGERVDFITVDTKGIWRCYEIKTSLSDFNSNANLSFVGHYNYFVLTPELYEKVKDIIPKEIGVYAGTNHFNLKCVKRAKKQDLKIDEQILFLSMIRSLHRDAEKLHKSENPRIIEDYNRTINNLRNENRQINNELAKIRFALRSKFGWNWQEEIGLD